MRIVFVFVFSLFAGGALSAQNMKVMVPLEQELKTCTDTNRMLVILEQLTEGYEAFEVKKCLQYGMNLWEIGGLRKNSNAMFKAAYTLGSTYHFDVNDAAKSVDWHLKAYNIAVAMKDSTNIIDVAYRLAKLNEDNGDKDRAKKYYYLAFDIATAQKNYSRKTAVLVSLGDMLIDKTEKIRCYTEAYQAAQANPEDTIRMAQVLVTLGEYYRSVGAHSEAKVWYEKTYDQLKYKSEDSGITAAREMLALACLRIGRYDESIQSANLLINATPAVGASSYFTERGMKILAEAYYYNGYDSLAFFTAMKYIDLKDSLNLCRFNDRVQLMTFNVQSQLDLERKAQELEMLQTKNKYRNMLTYLSALIIMMLLGVALYLYWSRRRENQQNRKLAQLNQTKDKLLSIISHDVRSPIQALQNIITLFEQEIASKEDVRIVTKHVNASVYTMAQGLDNLFFWAQNQQQELKAYLELVNIIPLIINQIEQYQPIFVKKNIQIIRHLNDQQFVFADALQVRLIFSNVLANAVKFTPPSGEITVSVMQAGNEYCCLSIVNSGEPIIESDIPKIFDASIRYTRLGTKGEPGSGLGLSLTKDLVELNHGHIQITAIKGFGTKIELFFKVQKH